MADLSNRRQFLRDATIFGAGAAGLALVTPARAAAEKEAVAPSASSAEPFVVGVIGTGARGQAVAAAFAASPGVRVKYLCDVDEQMLAKGQAAVAKRLEKLATAAATRPSDAKSKDPAKSKPASDTDSAEPAAAKLGAGGGATTSPSAPIGVKDFRRVLEDKDVHAAVIVTPDHWHAPIAILACKAGKHVYVEKPCSHNPREGELIVEAARKYNRVVQHGTQRRSWPGLVKAIQVVRGGEIGNVRFSRGWYASNRKPIGRGKGVPVPSHLDYELWQGPAPERPYQDNLHPYNWHWFWNWGTGELGNNGVHFLDLCRWGLGVDYPKRVTSAGGRYFYSDDWETPDTQSCTFEFDDRMILWEHRSCQPHEIEGDSSGVSFHGDKGTVVLSRNGYKLYDLKDKLQHEQDEPIEIDPLHVADFVDAARKGRRPNAEIEEGHKSTLLCHLGNIALRAGRTLNIDPKTGRILGDSEVESKFWSREYRSGWEPTV